MTNLYNLIIIIDTNEMNFKFSCKYTKAWEAGQIRAKVIPKGHASREKTMPWYRSTIVINVIVTLGCTSSWIRMYNRNSWKTVIKVGRQKTMFVFKHKFTQVQIEEVIYF